MIPVILSGGSGTRLWPVSRTKLPKQFCHIFAESLHFMTLQRLTKLSTPWIVTSASLKALTEKQVRELDLPPSHIIYEPDAKNTAPAIGLLCHILSIHGYTDEVVGVFPSDHLIEKEKDFFSSIYRARDEAKKSKIVTLGIKPQYPATSFGYIQVTREVNIADYTASPVIKFHEKPSLEVAEGFLKDGSYYWNAGIFVFDISFMIDLFKEYQPEIWSKIETINPDLSNAKEVYNDLPNISIDYAIMEKLNVDTLSCIPADIGWNDVGSWDAIADLLRMEDTKSIEFQGKGNFTYSKIGEKSYAFAGVSDLIIVDTADALLVTKKGASQTVKDVVSLLQTKHPALLNDHVFEEKPWGKYEVLRDTGIFKSKVIHVNPKQQISYQSHSKREEHWLITQGEGEVVLDEQIIPVKPGSYIKIPLGAKHRIRNTGDKVIEFVEIQMGTYFGEDDIVRYQDDYNRL